MRGMVAGAKLAFDHDGNPFRRPNLTTKAERFGSAVQQSRQLCFLFGGQFRLWARGRMTPKSLDPLSFGTTHPLAHRAMADSQSFRNLALRPSLLSKLPSAQPATFAPIVRRF